MQTDHQSKMTNLSKTITESIFTSGVDFISAIGLLEIIKQQLIETSMSEESNVVSLRRPDVVL